MARIIMKSPYLKPNAGTHISNYVKYIATRENVEVSENTKKYLKPTVRQSRILNALLKENLDAVNLPEYKNYLDKPDRESADKLILQISKTHIEDNGNRERYLKYIAERPRVEKLSEHGLFTDEGVPIILFDVSKEIAKSRSNIWTHIISLSREDAERFGYDSAEAWMNLIRANRNMIAENMKISPENFRWYAAFHNEAHHPHIHMIAYSIEPDEAFLNEKGIENIKSLLAKEIFRDELSETYQQQTACRDELRSVSRDKIHKIVERVNQETLDNPELENRLFELSERLKKTKGKKQYGYLSQSNKALVNAIVDILSKDERIQELYDLWYEQRERVISTYTDNFPDRIPLSENKEFKSIKNAVIQEVDHSQ